MSIPDFQSLMLPVLREAARGEVKISDVVQTLARELNLSDEERAALLPSGKQTTFANRVHWAKSYLGKAGLVDLTRRARFRITEQGRKVLQAPPERIDIGFLEQFPSFQNFRDGGATPTDLPQEDSVQATGLTPDDLIREAQRQLDAQLALDLLARVQAAPPDFFERLVVQLLIAMGYGGSFAEAGRALGRSGDGGVDGVIDQDALGLDRIYVQAKRYATDNLAGPGTIRDFFGALNVRRATKGLFVTTSGFTKSALDTAEQFTARIVLMDGKQLANLMIRFNVGCRVHEVVTLKRLDEEFFDLS